eukprot:s204_g32.t1
MHGPQKQSFGALLMCRFSAMQLQLLQRFSSDGTCLEKVIPICLDLAFSCWFSHHLQTHPHRSHHRGSNQRRGRFGHWSLQ